MAYYFDHRQEIDDEIQRDVELTETLAKRDGPSPFHQRMKAEGRL
jgi:hypothetical protein